MHKNINFRTMSAEQIFQEFARYSEFVDLEKVKRWIAAYTHAPQQLKPRYLAMLNMMFAKLSQLSLQTDKPFLKVEESHGSLKFGRHMQGGKIFSECFISPANISHSAVIASTGHGKTVLLFNFCREIDRFNQFRNAGAKICRITIDRKKDFRNVSTDQVVLDINDLGISFYEQPPSCDFREWLSDVSQLQMSIGKYYFATRNYMVNTVNNLYEAKHKPPTVYEVYEKIKDDYFNTRKMSYRKTEILEVCLDRCENILRELEKCFRARKTFPLHEFIDGGVPLVVEADVSNDNFALIVGWFLLYVYRYNKSNDKRGSVTNGGTVLIFDEAYLMGGWDANKEFSESRRELGADFISTAGLYLRDFRCAIVAASQRVLSSDYMSSANLKIIGYSGDYRDARYLANSLGNPELLEIIPRLGIGEWIIKIGDKQPTLLKSDDCVAQRIPDKELKQRMQPFIEYIKNYCSEPEETVEVKEQKPHEKLSPEAKAMILHVYDHPLTKLTNRYEDLKLTGAKAQQIIAELREKGFAETIQEAIDNPHKSTYMVLRQPALDWLKSQGKDVSYLLRIGRVSFTHAFYAMVLSRTLRNLGWKVSNEYPVANKFVDVYAENKEDKKIAYEIAISPSVDAARVKSALNIVDEYVFLCKDMLIINSLENQLKHLASDKIKYYVASNYILDLKKAMLVYYIKNNQNNENKPENGDSSSKEERTRSDS